MFYLSYLFISVKSQQSWKKKFIKYIYMSTYYVKLCAKRQNKFRESLTFFCQIETIEIVRIKL